MHYFLKVILLSFRYKWTIALSVLNALAIAFLWGVSISAVYPFVEIVFEGKTLHTWVDEGFANADAEAARLRAEVETMRGQLEVASADERGALNGQIAIREGRIALQQKNCEFYQKARPWVQRFGPTTPFNTLLLVVVLLLLATVVKGTCLVLSVVLVTRIASSTIVDMRRTFFRELLRMDQCKIDRIGTSNLMTMLSHNVGLVQNGLVSLYGRSVTEPLKIVACLLIAAAISWPLLLFSMAVTPFGCYLIHYLAKRMRSAASFEMQGYAAVFQTLMDTIGGIKLVKIFTRHRRERRRFKRNSTSLHQMTMRISFYDAIVRPINEVLAMVVLCIAILAGATLVLNQETHLFGIPISTTPLTASQLFTFFAMLAGIADPARKLGDIYNSLFRATMASQSLYQTFEDMPLLIGPVKPEQTPLHQKSIRFDNATFGYHAESPVLNNINLEIPFGQTIALVGVNGSGKSTITNLLARFYDPQEGTITLDGVDLRNIRPRQLWKQMAIVTQDPILFRGTIFMNIRYGNQAATKEDVERAAELAHVTDFIHEIPRGFQGQVGDRGGFLSGGQRQRVALARAILANPRILILDEATSQMDVQVEVAIHESLREFLKQRTTILITHRLSTLTLADRVVVLKSGRIVEDVSAASTRFSKDHFLSLLAKAA